jgi:hypothetical protein
MLPFGYFDLIETFTQSGCAICNLLQHDVQKLIDNIIWEHTNDPFILDKMRSSRGLCNEHGWQFIEMAHAHQIAVFYEPALDELLKILDAIVIETKPQNFMRRLVAKNGSSVADALEPVQLCLVCDLQNVNEERYISIMAEHIINERMLQLTARPTDSAWSISSWYCGVWLMQSNLFASKRKFGHGCMPS